MGTLVQVFNNQPVVSSRKVAGHFEKRHADVLEAIRSIQSDMNNTTEFSAMFCLSEYRAEKNNKRNPEYLMNKNGFSLLVMGFTGSKATAWKAAYIKAFNEMEMELVKQRERAFGSSSEIFNITYRGQKVTTIKQIAEYLGVSVSRVSRAIVSRQAGIDEEKDIAFLQTKEIRALSKTNPCAKVLQKAVKLVLVYRCGFTKLVKYLVKHYSIIPKSIPTVDIIPSNAQQSKELIDINKDSVNAVNAMQDDIDICDRIKALLITRKELLRLTGSYQSVETQNSLQQAITTVSNEILTMKDKFLHDSLALS